MFRRFVVLLFLVHATAGATWAACEGTDLLEALPQAELAEIRARVDAVPYPSGNLWRAERGDSIIHVVGTFHIGDPRLDPLMERVAPLVADAGRVLVEVTPEEEQRLAEAMARDPSIAFITDGPSLPELLDDAEWRQYAAAMDARGVPAIVSSRFRPWLAFTTLSVPPCLLELPEQALAGLDDRIITYARDLDIPVEGLETWKVIHSLFDILTEAESLDILRAALIQSELSQDLFATLANAYFAGEHRLTWEFSRSFMPEDARDLFPSGRADDIFARLEQTLLIRRNLDWMEAILAHAEADRHLLVAVGAAHLGGHDGVLDLLDRAGYSLSPL